MSSLFHFDTVLDAPRAIMLVVALSSMGLPGLNGFVGEFLVLIGSFATARWWVTVAAVGVILFRLPDTPTLSLLRTAARGPSSWESGRDPAATITWAVRPSWRRCAFPTTAGQ